MTEKKEQVLLDSDMNELMKVRREKMAAFEAKNIEPFGRRFEATHHAQEIIDQYDELEDKTVKVAGRLMAVRGHGKASFTTLMDITGNIQLAAGRADSAAAAYDLAALRQRIAPVG